MGGRISRRRDAPAEQKPAEAQTATEPAAQAQEVVQQGNLDVAETVTPAEECVSECKEVTALESQPEVQDAPAPAQPEPLVSVSEPSPPETEPAVEPTLVAEVQLAPESAPETEPVAAPEPVPEPEPVAAPEAEADAVLEPISEPPPAEALKELIEVGVSDGTAPSTSPIPVPVNADDPSDIPAVEECPATAEAPAASLLDSEKCEETSEPVEAEGVLEQAVNDVNEESVSELLQNLELKGNAPAADLIPTDVEMADDTPVPEVSP